MPDLVRKTYNFSGRVLNALAKIQDTDDYNETDTVSRALLLNAALLDYMNDGTLVIVDKNGDQVKVVMI